MTSQPALKPSFATVLGHKIAYLDSRQGRQTLLMVHGNPVSAHVYERLIGRLRSRYRCVAPDLLGFGRSDKPSQETEYSLPKHIDIMAEFVQGLDLRNVVLVAHDWGGPIGLGAALRETERYTHLIILNTLTEAPMKIRPRYWLPFHVLLRLRPVADYLMKELNLFQKMGVAIMDEADQAVYFRANHSAATRAGIAAFPRMIPYHAGHHNYPLLRDILVAVERWDIPALVLFSDRDSVFSAGQGKRLANRMIDARFSLVAGAHHFLQYERTPEVASAIGSFLQERP